MDNTEGMDEGAGSWFPALIRAIDVIRGLMIPWFLQFDAQEF